MIWVYCFWSAEFFFILQIQVFFYFFSFDNKSEFEDMFLIYLFFNFPEVGIVNMSRLCRFPLNPKS